MGRLAGLVVGAVALACSACGGASSTTSPPAYAPVTTPTTTSTGVDGIDDDPDVVPAEPSPGCTKSTAAAPGTVTLTPIIGGKERTAIVHLPTGYTPPTPVPLVVNMHGSRSTALQQMGLTGMDTTADADTFIVVYPQGDIAAGTGYDWNVPGEPLIGGAAVPAGSPDDVAFIEELVSSLEQRYCIDRPGLRHRVLRRGPHGQPAGVRRLAVFAAIAPVSGLRRPKPCPFTRPVPVVAFHGTADPVDPYFGHGQKYWTYSVPSAAKRWARYNRCPTAGHTSRVAATVVLTTYGPCPGARRWSCTPSWARGTNGPAVPTWPRPSRRCSGPSPRPSVPTTPCGRSSWPTLFLNPGAKPAEEQGSEECR